jgi:energy-coupling factor transport system ATP-binding protein
MIEIDQLEYVHPGGVPALRGIQVTLAPEQCTALMGPNGSGKTTLARCLNGLLTPSSGTVSVDGVEVTESSLPDIRRRVAMVFQNPDDALVAPTVETDIAFGLENLGLPPAQMRERVQEILEAFHLERYREHPPHLLSGGERQRLAVASAIAVRPDYLILDEPTALLDPGAREELMLLIGQLSLRRKLLGQIACFCSTMVNSSAMVLPERFSPMPRSWTPLDWQSLSRSTVPWRPPEVLSMPCIWRS